VALSSRRRPAVPQAVLVAKNRPVLSARDTRGRHHRRAARDPLSLSGVPLGRIV